MQTLASDLRARPRCYRWASTPLTQPSPQKGERERTEWAARSLAVLPLERHARGLLVRDGRRPSRIHCALFTAP
jgi:hypothetical protein